MQLGWKVLIHPPYSPDLAPTDYRLFNSLSNFLRGKQYDNADEVDADLKEFLASKPKSFYKSGIEKLFTRWKQVVDKEGDYIIH